MTNVSAVFPSRSFRSVGHLSAALGSWFVVAGMLGAAGHRTSKTLGRSGCSLERSPYDLLAVFHGKRAK
jgi:hypothetical protein